MRELAKTYNEAREDIFVREGRKYPGKDLVDMELRPGYNEAKEKKIWDMLAINEAHLIMLVEQGIVSKEDGRILFECIENMDYRKYESYEYSGKLFKLMRQIKQGNEYYSTLIETDN